MEGREAVNFVKKILLEIEKSEDVSLYSAKIKEAISELRRIKPFLENEKVRENVNVLINLLKALDTRKIFIERAFEIVDNIIATDRREDTLEGGVGISRVILGQGLRLLAFKKRGLHFIAPYNRLQIFLNTKKKRYENYIPFFETDYAPYIAKISYMGTNYVISIEEIDKIIHIDRIVFLKSLKPYNKKSRFIKGYIELFGNRYYIFSLKNQEQEKEMREYDYR
jgi:hypothetical protein